MIYCHFILRQKTFFPVSKCLLLSFFGLEKQKLEEEKWKLINKKKITGQQHHVLFFELSLCLTFHLFHFVSLVSLSFLEPRFLLYLQVKFKWSWSFIFLWTYFSFTCTIIFNSNKSFIYQYPIWIKFSIPFHILSM